MEKTIEQIIADIRNKLGPALNLAVMVGNGLHQLAPEMTKEEAIKAADAIRSHILPALKKLEEITQK
jgi:hypothetical protein